MKIVNRINLSVDARLASGNSTNTTVSGPYASYVRTRAPTRDDLARDQLRRVLVRFLDPVVAGPEVGARGDERDVQVIVLLEFDGVQSKAGQGAGRGKRVHESLGPGFCVPRLATAGCSR